MSSRRKTARAASRRESAFILGNILPFLSGLSIGLLIAFFVYLRYQIVEPVTDAEPDRLAKVAEAQPEPEKPDVKFTFYDTLRNKKVSISEWMAREKDLGGDPQTEAGEQAAAESPAEEQGESSVAEQEQYAVQERDAEDEVTAYVLQVGSFRDFASADRIKAELALLGVFADIQRVMLNEQDVRHRVRLGPYTSVDAVQEVRHKLSNNNIEFMLIELR